ncbi:TMV resistance protein N-like protein isoform X1 [Tanacetum coccineum]|uniref:TMV resistance protein N-like protein isoform X1 n=1 Tax=Tanacetum coccineum TaxID=301880 RepID=A0ABQ5J4X6_9ASTR
MACLRFTTNFDELPNLKGFMLDNCRLLEEIHPSIGYSKSLEFIEIETCYSLKIFPSITWSTKLNTVKILYCPNLVKVSKTQQGSPDMIQRELSPYSRYPTNLEIQQVHIDVIERDVLLPHKQYPTKPRKRFGFRMCCCNDFGSDTELNTQPHKLEDLRLPYYNINHIGLQLSHIGLRKLYLNHCDLRNADIKSAVGVLPNLQELDLSGNMFSEVKTSGA